VIRILLADNQALVRGALAALLDLEVVEQLRAELPDVRSLIVTTFGRPGYVRRVHAGLRVVDPDLATESLMAGPSSRATGHQSR
jgi:hypothetical protein